MAGLSLRRTRLAAATRELVREVDLDPRKLIQPLFVVEGLAARFPLEARMRYARVVVRDSNGLQAWTQPVFLD